MKQKLFLNKIKFLLFCTVFTLFAFKSALPSHAQTGTSQGNDARWVITPDKVVNSGNNASAENFISNTTLSGIISGVTLALEGIVTQNGTDASGQSTYRMQGGATAMLVKLSSTLYTNQPASSVEYLADLGSNIGIVKPALAQGTGFAAFSPILVLWKAFRDIAYLAFVIIFVVVGLMIMFRKKIDPRTVATVQDALPRIVVTLILVTFSYAIGGLIIDISTLITKLIGNAFASTGLIAIPRPDITAIPQYQTGAGILNELYTDSIFSLVYPLITSKSIATAIAGPDFWTQEVGGQALSVLGWITFQVVFAILGFFVMFKIFFALIGPYVSVVLTIVFAPIQLLVGAIPGSPNSVTKWIKNLIANVAVFPVTMTMLFIAAIFKSGNSCGLYDPGGLGSGCWPNQAFYSTGKEFFTINWQAIGFGPRWGNVAGQLIGFGILFTIPKVAEIVKGMLEGKELPLEQVAGQEIKGGFGRIPILKSILPQ